MAIALPPLPVSSLASDWRRSTRRAPSTTLAPCAERSRAVASPSPLLAPVMTTTFPAMLLLIRAFVLLVRDLLHPVDDLAVERFLNGDMGHAGGRHRAVPMLFTRRARDHVTRSNHSDRSAPALHQSTPRRNDQGLTQRMRVPVA